MNRWYFLSPLILQKLIWIPTRLILWFFGHLEVKGLENLKDLRTNAIFAVNHSSELDPILLPAALPLFSRFSPIFYTSREQSFYKHSGWRQRFYGGAFFKAWGAYPVSVGLHDYDKSLVNQARIMNDGGDLCIFPEGRKTTDGNIQKAKGGVAYLSYITKKPIVPVHYTGTYRLSMGEFFSRKRHLTVSFGAPIYAIAKADRYPSYDMFKDYAETVMDEIRKLSPSPMPMPITEPEARLSPLRPDPLLKTRS